MYFGQRRNSFSRTTSVDFAETRDRDFYDYLANAKTRKSCVRQEGYRIDDDGTVACASCVHAKTLEGATWETLIPFERHVIVYDDTWNVDIRLCRYCWQPVGTIRPIETCERCFGLIPSIDFPILSDIETLLRAEETLHRQFPGIYFLSNDEDEDEDEDEDILEIME